MLKSLWIEERFTSLPEESRHLLLYLITSPHTNSLGYYRLPNQYICADLQWDLVRVEKAWEPLEKSGLAHHCHKTQIVFLPENFKTNAPENPNVIKKWKLILLELPFSPLLKDFIAGARKYLPNGWQTAWLSDVSERVAGVEGLVESSAKGMAEGSAKGLAKSSVKGMAEGSVKGMAKQETRSKKPEAANRGFAAISGLYHGADPNPEVKQVLDTVTEKLGYSIPFYAKEGKAVKRALKMGFTPDQFIACWDKMKMFSFWKGKWLPLAKVTENLGEFVAGRLEEANVGQKRVRPKPDQARRRPITYISGAEIPP